MRWTKPFLATCVVALLLAVALSMVTVSMDPADNETADEVTVPVGKTGDRVLYDTYDEDGKWVSSTEHQIGEAKQILDQDMRITPVVDVFSAFQFTQDHSYWWNESIRLSDRVAVQSFRSEQVNEQWLNTTGFYQNGALLPAAELQGKVLKMDDRFAFSVMERNGGSSGGGSGSGQTGLDPVYVYRQGRTTLFVNQGEAVYDLPEQVEGVVTLKGDFDGETAYAVSVHHVELPHPDRHAPDVKQIEWNTTYWLSDLAPYPLLTETNGTVVMEDDTTSQATYFDVLVEYAPGDMEIPWGREPADAFDPEMASSGGLHPAEGSGKGLAYSLEQAIEDAETQPLDPEWLLWRLENPEAVLVGAMMTPGALTGMGQQTTEWRLVYMGETDAYEVRTERHPENPVPLVEGMGLADVPLESYSPDDPMLTVSSLVELWEEYHDGPEGRPTFFQWGLVPTEWRMSDSCVVVSWSISSINADPHDLLQQVRVGHASFGPCRSLDPDHVYDALLVDATTPRLITHYEKTYDPGETNGRSGSGAGVPEWSVASDHQEGLVSMGFGPPELDRGAAVAVPLILVLLTAYFLPALQFAVTKGLLFVPGFSRIKRSKVLDHKLRERLHTLIRENPGVSPTRLKEETGAGWGTIVHHLAVMEREDIVASKVEGRHRRFFVASEVPPGERASLAVLANRRTQDLYSDLLEHPGLATGELAERIGLSHPGAHWHLKRLHKCGLVCRRREGRFVRYYPSGSLGPESRVA